jgi:hypothetical protein
MHPQALLLAGLALATGIAADRLLTTTSCPWIGACNSNGEWINDFGQHFYINANDDCRDPGIPAFEWICMDWANQRMSFKVQGQNQRCMRKGADFDVGPCAGAGANCRRAWYDEVSCDW